MQHRKSIRKFVIFSAFGCFLYLVPIVWDGSLQIPVGILVDLLSSLLPETTFMGIVVSLISITSIMTMIASIFKPRFLNQYPRVKATFYTKPFYFISRITGWAIALMVYFRIGPDFLINDQTGGYIMSVCMTLLSIIIVMGITLPFLTDFGLMEFVGAFIQKYIRPLFTCPGRAAVDFVTSWLGDSNAGVLLTKRQYEIGFYTAREAAVICTNFSLVSISTCFIISSLAGISSYFVPLYLTATATGVFLAMVMPRIYPLKQIPDTYDVEKHTTEEISMQGLDSRSKMKKALMDAGERAGAARVKNAMVSMVEIMGGMCLDLFPIIFSWGTLFLLVAHHTPVFQYLSYPVELYLKLFGIEEAATVAPAAIMSITNLYLPAMLLNEAFSLRTSFIVCALILVQIINFTDVGIIIVKSRIPLNFIKLFIIFIERTVIGLPFIVLVSCLVF